MNRAAGTGDNTLRDGFVTSNAATAATAATDRAAAPAPNGSLGIDALGGVLPEGGA
jgi:hypothetical protein